MGAAIPHTLKIGARRCPAKRKPATCLSCTSPSTHDSHGQQPRPFIAQATTSNGLARQGLRHWQPTSLSVCRVCVNTCSLPLLRVQGTRGHDHGTARKNYFRVVPNFKLLKVRGPSQGQETATARSQGCLAHPSYAHSDIHAPDARPQARSAAAGPQLSDRLAARLHSSPRALHTPRHPHTPACSEASAVGAVA